MLWALASTLSMGLAGLLIFIYFLRKGEFDNIEDVKYQMFRHDDETDGR